MMRSVLSFFSMLAFGAMMLGAFAVLLPWLQGRVATDFGPAGPFQLESGLVGLSVGLLLGFLNQYSWGDIPRRVINWILVRERQFFYYALIVGCVGVLIFY